jgi:predicted pyridoxine 5'-phosphate oxidase superfamily flavin-nucleotide-binding protein
MANIFSKIAFTKTVKEIQELMGSRKSYARLESGPDGNHDLTENEIGFISQRDSFYTATIGETGWPYIQHRGGPVGFLKVLSKNQIGFADFSGNRQYITVGNVTTNPRIAMILVDYPNRERLKILGKVKLINLEEDPALIGRLTPEDYGAKVERGFLINIEGFDWNCPQHITPRWTADEIKKAVLPLQEKIAELELRLKGK